MLQHTLMYDIPANLLLVQYAFAIKHLKLQVVVKYEFEAVIMKHQVSSGQLNSDQQ